MVKYNVNKLYNTRIVVINGVSYLFRRSIVKKFLSALLLCTFLLALTVGLSGCKRMNAESKLKLMIENALKEKYKEEFECIQVYGKNPSGTYNAICFPQNKEELMFDATIYPNGELGYDCYPNSIAAKYLSKAFDDELEDIWGRHFTYCYRKSGLIDDEETACKIADGNFTFEYYLKHINETYSANNSTLAYYTICVDSSKINVSYGDEWDSISNALDNVYEIGLSCGANLYFIMNIYFVPPELYDDCMNYFKNNAEVRSNLREMIEGYPEREHQRCIAFSINKDKDKFSPTKEEYVKLRKEVD